MLSCAKILFVETDVQDSVILGRSAREYLEREFIDFECDVVTADKLQNYPFDGVTVVLPFNIPLVRQADITRALSDMRRRKIKSLSLGEKNSIARICDEWEDSNFFATGSAFVKLGGAKSYNIVYNQLKERIIDRNLSREVTILDGSTVVIDDTVRLSPGAVILPFTRLEGECEIAAGAVIEASYLSNSFVGEGGSVRYSHLVSSRVGARATVGPYARLRGADVGEGCRIGDFVEIKASVVRAGAKAAHLTYIGDAEVGEGTNVGCGTVFCNYDGKNKHRTSIGKDCFIGANVNLVAPLTVGDNAFIAAGTTVTKPIREGTFTIGRVRQETKNKPEVKPTE